MARLTYADIHREATPPPDSSRDREDAPAPRPTAPAWHGAHDPMDVALRFMDNLNSMIHRGPALIDALRTATAQKGQAPMASNGHQPSPAAFPAPEQAPEQQAPAPPPADPMEAADAAFLHLYEVCKYVAAQVDDTVTVGQAVERMTAGLGVAKRKLVRDGLKGQLGEHWGSPLRRVLLFGVPFKAPELTALLLRSRELQGDGEPVRE